jgi:hypothetical protein
MERDQFEKFEIKIFIQAAGHSKDASRIVNIFIIIISFQGRTAHMSGNETLVAVAFTISHTKCQKRGLTWYNTT